VDEQSPDLIVLDAMMPDLDGFEVCRRLRNDGVNVRGFGYALREK
jgi:two-component system OmpR family response regulator